MFLKIATQAFEAGNFFNILLRFLDFEAHFLIKVFLIKKKTCAMVRCNGIFAPCYEVL